MTERPIIFRDMMVRAILAGTKTVTRRVMTPQPIDDGGTPVVGSYHPIVVRRGIEEPGPKRWGASTEDRSWPCPYGRPGDRLWVREAWRAEERASDLIDGVRFRSDDVFVPIQNTPEAAEAWIDAYRWPRGAAPPAALAQWRPSTHMPRWASRLTLEVTSVRVERLQAISSMDAIDEGIDATPPGQTGWRNYLEGNSSPGVEPVVSFSTLWDSLGTREGCSWAENPWVWVIGFKRIQSKENK